MNYVNKLNPVGVPVIVFNHPWVAPMAMDIEALRASGNPTN